MDDAARNAAFRALLPVLEPYGKRWKSKLTYDADECLGHFSVDVKGPGAPGFATLFSHLNDVRLYCYPLNVWKDLAELLPAAVRKRIVSGSVFVFKTPVTAQDKQGIATLLAAAARRIADRMLLAPKLPYTKKLTAKQMAAFNADAPAKAVKAARARSSPRTRSSPRSGRRR